MAGTPHKITNGQAAWTGKTKTAAEAARDKDLDRLFDDLNWEPIVVPFPRGVMIGFLNWAGNWESYTHWHHQTAEQRRSHGCTIDSERDRQKVRNSLHRHVAALVRDTEGTEAGLEYLWHEDREGKEDYLQMDVWQAAYKAAKAEGKGDVEAREVADMARAEFANRPEREPVRSLETALALLPAGNPIPVREHVWRLCLEQADALTCEGRFLVFRQGQEQAVWCDNPHPHDESAWITDTLIAGYLDAEERFCLLQLGVSDQVLPAPFAPLAAGDLPQE